ncbi:alpha glucosidase [Halocynthiibacter sp. C4]|uniref:alpha-glucosidase n=1 Tax=Halocynthiibacter sp. C4 TaxID=2992758 RepID=UPI00237C2CF9|nr:alpha-glucosidase [Halocynthiibacter sp. C4]MDE0588344.1 alpha glucosidase [Halocynthiibacter sp. C4]
MSEWWRGATIYQIYPRSFQDSTGNGIGDLNGITKRLDHVAALGVEAIWLSPIFMSPMKDMGYDVSDYTDIDPLFGTLADFDALIARAHELGLKVIVDQVLSHTSDQHEWFKESRTSRTNDKADWYVWAEPSADGMPPNNWPSVFGGAAWEWEPRRRQYYLHNFLIEQPDLNMHNADVQDEILKSMRFWLESGVDGFRLDTVNYYFHDTELRNNPPAPQHIIDEQVDTYGMQNHIYSKNRPENIAFLKRMRALTDEFDARMMVGEVGDGGQTAIDIMGEYTRGDDRLHMCYSFEMLGPKFTAAHFRNTIEGFQKGAPDGWPSWSFSNHDVQRHVTRWSEFSENPDDLAKQAAAMLMSFEGTIGIYQGEELGLAETELEYSELTDPPGLRFWPENKGRDGCRTPMVWDASEDGAGFSAAKPWLPVKEPQKLRSVNTQTQANDSVLHAYRETIAFRKMSDALVKGSTEFIDLPEPLLAFHRVAEGQTLTCVFNLSKSSQTVSLGSEAKISGPHNASISDGNLILGPNGFAYLESGETAGVTLKKTA